MTLAQAFLTFFTVWFISVFFVLPFARGRGLRWGLVVNTLLAIVLTVSIYLLLISGLVPLRQVY